MLLCSSWSLSLPFPDSINISRDFWHKSMTPCPKLPSYQLRYPYIVYLVYSNLKLLECESLENSPLELFNIKYKCKFLSFRGFKVLKFCFSEPWYLIEGISPGRQYWKERNQKYLEPLCPAQPFQTFEPSISNLAILSSWNEIKETSTISELKEQESKLRNQKTLSLCRMLTQ